MIWLFAAFITNIIEQLIIRYSLDSLDIIVFAFLFYLFGTFFTFLYHFRKKHTEKIFDWPGAVKELPLLLTYISAAFLANALWFVSVVSIGLGMTAFILIFIRIIVTTYSYLFMQDKIGTDKAIALVIGFGALLVFSATGYEVPTWGVLLAFLSCFGFAAETIARKKLVERKANIENMLILRQASSCILWGVLLLFSIYVLGDISSSVLHSIEMTALGFIILVAFLGGMLLHLFSFQAMKTVRLSLYESINSMKPVVIASIGAIFFGEVITTLQIISGTVVIVSSLYFLRPDLPSKLNVP